MSQKYNSYNYFNCSVEMLLLATLIYVSQYIMRNTCSRYSRMLLFVACLDGMTNCKYNTMSVGLVIKQYNWWRLAGGRCPTLISSILIVIRTTASYRYLSLSLMRINEIASIVIVRVYKFIFYHCREAFWFIRVVWIVLDVSNKY